MQPPKYRAPWSLLPASHLKTSDSVNRFRPHEGYNLVRVGPRGDGGYLVPDDLSGLAGAISPGVSTQCGFDIDLADRGMPVVMADASVEGPPVAHPKFIFVKKFVGRRETESETRVESLAAFLPSEDDLLLQMDIEGAEYDVIETIPDELLSRFRIMVIEFHALHRWLRRRNIKRLRAVFDKLLTHHVVVHTHPNNCQPLRAVSGMDVPPVLEITFYRKDRAAAVPKGAVRIPHPLDADNVPGNPTVVLPDWRA